MNFDTVFENNLISYCFDPTFDEEALPLKKLINLTTQPEGSYNLISQKDLHIEMDTLVKNKKNVLLKLPLGSLSIALVSLFI